MIFIYFLNKCKFVFQIVPSGTPYFYAEIPTGEKLLHRISRQFPNIQLKLYAQFINGKNETALYRQ
jgi:hypothetical protein